MTLKGMIYLTLVSCETSEFVYIAEGQQLSLNRVRKASQTLGLNIAAFKVLIAGTRSGQCLFIRVYSAAC